MIQNCEVIIDWFMGEEGGVATKWSAQMALTGLRVLRKSLEAEYSMWGGVGM